MFVTTGCSSRRQFVATASRQDTGSRQQNTDSGRQVTASGQFYKPSQTQESKYSSYDLLLLCGLKGKMDLPSMSETSCNFCYLYLLNTSLKGVAKIVENQFLKSCFELSLAIFITGCPEILQKHFRPIYQKRIGIIITDSHFSIFVCNSWVTTVIQVLDDANFAVTG